MVGKHDKIFVANFVLNLAVKEIVKIGQHLPKLFLRVHVEWHAFVLTLLNIVERPAVVFR